MRRSTSDRRWTVYAFKLTKPRRPRSYIEVVPSKNKNCLWNYIQTSRTAAAVVTSPEGARSRRNSQKLTGSISTAPMLLLCFVSILYHFVNIVFLIFIYSKIMVLGERINISYWSWNCKKDMVMIITTFLTHCSRLKLLVSVNDLEKRDICQTKTVFLYKKNILYLLF